MEKINMESIKAIKKYPNVYKSLILKRVHCRELEENINKLKKDLVYFLEKKKQSRKLKEKPVNLQSQIKKIIDKLETSKEDHKILLKSLQVNMDNKKKFFNQKELDKFREKKKYLLKIVNHKIDMHKTISDNDKNRNTHNKNLNINNFNKTVFSFNRDNNNLIENRIHDNKSSENNYFKCNNIFNNTKYKSKIRLESRNLKFKKKNILLKPGTTQNRNILSVNFNDQQKLNSIDSKESKEKIKLKDQKKEISSISSNYKIDNNIDPDSMYNLKKKLGLEKLKLKVDKFENSNKFYPVDKIIYKNYIYPFTFLKRKNLNQYELDIFDKEENRKFMNKRKRMRKINSLSKLRFNKTQSYFNRKKYILTSKSKDKNKTNNAKIIIKKINILKKRANNRKISMKTFSKKRNKNYAKSLMDYLSYDEGKIIDDNLEKDIKKEVLKYKDDLGCFTYAESKSSFSRHFRK